MKLLLILLLAGCATLRPPAAGDVCYTPAEEAARKKWFNDAEAYEDKLSDDLRAARKFRTSIEGLKGYCS